jgi:hypothetical protein
MATLTEEIQNKKTKTYFHKLDLDQKKSISKNREILLIAEGLCVDCAFHKNCVWTQNNKQDCNEYF